MNTTTTSPASALARKQRKLALENELGRYLARCRRERHIKQADVAAALGFKRPLVSKIEHGQRSIDAVELLDYARAIDMDVNELYAKLSSIVAEYDRNDHHSS